MVAVWGMELAIRASWAMGVPGIEARTADFGPSGGIRWKVDGNCAGGTKVQEP